MARSSNGKGNAKPRANTLPELLITLADSSCFKQYSTTRSQTVAALLAEKLRSATVSSPTPSPKKFQFEPPAVDEEIDGAYGDEFERTNDASRGQSTWILSDQIGTLWGAT